MNRLMLCAGAASRPGWMTLDSDPKHGPNYLATVPPLPEIISRTKWDEIELVHGITSFYPWEAYDLLREIRDILTPRSRTASGGLTQGKLILEQPDLHYVADAIASGSGSVEWLFGDPKFLNPAHMNKWAYSPDSLRKLLESAGFSNVVRLQALYHNPIRDFRMEAWV
jgi:hypothetical protein